MVLQCECTVNNARLKRISCLCSYQCLFLSAALNLSSLSNWQTELKVKCCDAHGKPQELCEASFRCVQPNGQSLKTKAWLAQLKLKVTRQGCTIPGSPGDPAQWVSHRSDSDWSLQPTKTIYQMMWFRALAGYGLLCTSVQGQQGKTSCQSELVWKETLSQTVLFHLQPMQGLAASRCKQLAALLWVVQSE